MITEDHATETLLTESGLKLNDSPTPNLSELARKGLIFANAFLANANTGPSTASLLTGQHPHANYVLHNGDKFGGIKTNLAKILQENGYETALFGKWDFGSQPQGFSHWEILSDGDQFYNPEFWNPKGKKNIEGHTTDCNHRPVSRMGDAAAKRFRPKTLLCPYSIQWNPKTMDARITPS